MNAKFDQAATYNDYIDRKAKDSPIGQSLAIFCRRFWANLKLYGRVISQGDFQWKQDILLTSMFPRSRRSVGIFYHLKRKKDI